MTTATHALSAVTQCVANVKVSAAAVLTVAAPVALAPAQHVKTTTAAVVYSGVRIAAEASAPAAWMTMKGAPIAMTKKLPKNELSQVMHRPTALRFSPTAWAKLLFLRDAGDTEIGGFGITSRNDLLFVKDVQLVQQICTWVNVKFEDEAVANFFDDQVDAGRRPEEFGRVWVHTHPGNSPQPSGMDESTFTRVFGRSDWAVMFILARGGQTFARLRYNSGPGVDVQIPVEVDYCQPFAASEQGRWGEEYAASVRMPLTDPPEHDVAVPNNRLAEQDQYLEDWWRDWSEYADFNGSPQEADHGFDRDF